MKDILVVTVTDVRWWAEMNPFSNMFTGAAQKADRLNLTDEDAEFLWEKGTNSLKLRGKKKVKAIRKRVRAVRKRTRRK